MLALALVTLRFVLPRLMGITPSRGGQRRLRLVEALPLDRQHRIALLRAGDREYLVGLGGGRVTPIDAWPAPSEAAAAEAAAPEVAATTPPAPVEVRR